MNKFEGLTYIVQVSERGIWWRNIAAFDNKVVAELYANDCKGNGLPVDYRVIAVADLKD